mmetsp:Transcript_47417/g.141556  ORF Transcript_47417/g.141556 Transcript_47417/m.141556 type:complete len:599 (-) Transcript_47417:66-1862(-)
MSAKAWQMQQDVSSILKRIEGDIHEFTGCLQRAEATVNQEDQERCRTELEALSSRLQDHRAEIRRWSAQLDAKAKGRLGAARAHIEQELRRFKTLEARLRPKVAPKNAADQIATSKAADVAETKAEAPQLAAEEAEVKANPGEVKVLVEQLMRDAIEKNDMCDEFICKICLVNLVGCKPKLTSCSHLFCGDCLEQWFAVQPGSQSWARRACSAGTVPCPVCKEMLHEERNLHLVGPGGHGGSALLWQMLSTLPIMCANHPKCNPKGHCDWKGEYGRYQEHIRECKNMPRFSASTSPTVTPEFTPAASRVDDFERLRLDSASSEDGSFSLEVDDSQPAGAARRDPLPPQRAEGPPADVTQCMPETEIPLEPPQPTPESDEPATQNQEAVSAADKATVSEDEEASPRAPAAPLATSMADLTSLIGALYELKVQERMRSIQAGGEGEPTVRPPSSAPMPALLSGSAPALVPAPSSEPMPAPLSSSEPALAPAPPCEPADEEALAKELVVEAKPKCSEKKPKAQPQPKADSKIQQATQPGLAAQMALHAQMQSVRAAQLQAAQWHAAQWQMAQAAQWQQWQAAQWQAQAAAQWNAAQQNSSR